MILRFPGRHGAPEQATQRNIELSEWQNFIQRVLRSLSRSRCLGLEFELRLTSAKASGSVHRASDHDGDDFSKFVTVVLSTMMCASVSRCYSVGVRGARQKKLNPISS